MPLNFAKILNEGHKDEFDVAREGMTLMSLVEAMGIASKRGLMEGMTHGEAEDLLGEKLTVFFKEKTGMARYVDMVLFARMMIAKGEKVGNNNHMKLLSYNRKFMAIHNKLSEAEKKLVPVKKGVTPFLKTLHHSGMNILDGRGHGNIGDVHVWHWLFRYKNE